MARTQRRKGRQGKGLFYMGKQSGIQHNGNRRLTICYLGDRKDTKKANTKTTEIQGHRERVTQTLVKSF